MSKKKKELDNMSTDALREYLLELIAEYQDMMKALKKKKKYLNEVIHEAQTILFNLRDHTTDNK